jgi:UDP-3-O-[3-hydroxymyristoyl] glucosamine N-acyltransferase
LGADGFGFEPNAEGRLQKVPQLAKVVLGDDVEVGANTCIDRGAIQDTLIGDGTKLDNLVQVGHNTRIGKHNVFSAACAIGGSTTIGDHNMWGGQTATAGHLTVGSRVTAMGRSGITKDIPDGVTIQGFPAQHFKTEWKEQAVLRKWAKDQLKTKEKQHE